MLLELAAWKFVLEGQAEKGKKEPSLFAWKEWKEVGPIRVAMLREGQKGGINIRFENVAVANVVDEAALAVPQ